MDELRTILTQWSKMYVELEVPVKGPSEAIWIAHGKRIYYIRVYLSFIQRESLKIPSTPGGYYFYFFIFDTGSGIKDPPGLL